MDVRARDNNVKRERVARRPVNPFIIASTRVTVDPTGHLKNGDSVFSRKWRQF